MKLATLTTIQKISLIALGFFVFLGLAIFLIAGPLVGQIKNNGLELSEKKQNIELLYQDWQVLENSRKEYTKVINELNSLPAILPAGEALKFIMLLENIAQNTHSRQEVSVINSASAADGENPLLNFQVTLYGSFPNLVRFIAQLENAPYYNEINSIQAKGLSDKDLQSLKEGERTGLEVGDLVSTLKISVYQ